MGRAHRGELDGDPRGGRARCSRTSDELANFQDISKDQIEITDDDRWKTFFLYGYGFEAKLGVEMCPRTAALMREIPGMTTAMFSILSPRKHILDHRGPYKGVLRYHLGLIVPEDAESCRIRVGEDIRHWEEGRSMVFDDTFNHEVWNDTDETRVVLFVDVLRPLPFPESAINRAIIKAIGFSPFVLDAKRNQQAWERRFLRAPRSQTAGHAVDGRCLRCSSQRLVPSLGVQHGELAREDQHAEHDHHRAADGDDHREVALDDARARRSCARTRARSAGTGSPGPPSRRRAAARRGRPSWRSRPG